MRVWVISLISVTISSTRLWFSIACGISAVCAADSATQAVLPLTLKVQHHDPGAWNATLLWLTGPMAASCFCKVA